jgi:formamidopyrimidine-DNA glycosylase
MPELPEVETVRRGLARCMEGRRLAQVELRRPDLRFPLPVGLRETIEGRIIRRLGRRGKYLLLYLEGEGVVILHLGMSGRLIAMPPGIASPVERHDHVLLTLDDGTTIRFNDARRFGMLDYAEEAALPRHKLLAGMGPEPLDDGFTGAVLAASLAGKATSLKAALLDQRIVAGLGNIYVSESLYWARLSPQRQAGSVSGALADRLVKAIRDTLNRAIAAGGSSLRDYVQASGELGYFQHQWAVYGKAGQPCPDCRCREGIKQIVQGGRSTFYCAMRQR